MSAEPRTITDLARALRNRSVTAQSVTERCLTCISERDSSIGAFITVLAEDARAQALRADHELATGRDRGPLHGVPISLKDLLDLRGIPTTAASRVRRHHVATADAPVVARLRDAGVVFIGKTNLHEFALGTTNEDSAYGPVHHPLDASRSPGGSSGGSAASVLAGMAYASIGTDTGGSIRIPSAACGLVGLKPAYGDISTDGIVPLSPTLDHVGPLCRSVDDAVILYEAMRTTAANGPPSPLAAHRVRLGLLGGYFLDVLDHEVRSQFSAACTRLLDAGVSLSDAHVSHATDIAPIYQHIVLSDAAAFHAATLERCPEDYTTNVRLRLEMGRYILAEDYVRALRGRDVLTREVDAALRDHDALLLPAMAVPATILGATMVRAGHVEESIRNITLRLTQLFNLTGHAAISVPCGRTSAGLPVGAQLVGRSTSALLRVAQALEPLLVAYSTD